MAPVLDLSADSARLRACVRDLVALSAMPAWWIGRAPSAINESLRELLASMLRADVVYVELRDLETMLPYVVADGASRAAIEAVLRGPLPLDEHDPPTLTTPDMTVRLAGYAIGMDGELGRLAVGSCRENFPSELESILLSVAANQIAVALQHRALLVRRQRAEQLATSRAAQQAAVARLGLEALGGLPLDAFLDNAVRTICDTLHASYGEVLELAADQRSMLLRAGVGWRAGLVGSARVGVGLQSQAGYTLESTEPVIVQDLRQETRFTAPALLREHGVVSGMTVIIHGPGAPFGVLGTHACEARAFSSDDVHFLQSVANLMAAALERSHVEAERELLLQRTSAARAEAERASRGKSEFLGIMSHELRTPLNAIAGFVQLLELEIHGPLTEAQRADLARIRRGQQYLLSLINNVLTFLKLGSGQLQFDVADVPVNEVVAAVEDLIRPLVQGKQLRYEQRLAADHTRVRVDRNKLQQILLNLLSNAVKFTEPGGSITLDCDASGEELLIHVRDTGRGIPEGKLASVFEPFVQVDTTRSRAAEGTGLGLAISRDFATRMGGSLTVKSEEGCGSVFSLSLPAADRPPNG